MLLKYFFLLVQIVVDTRVEINTQNVILLELDWDSPSSKHVVGVEDGLVIQNNITMCVQTLEYNVLIY